MRASPFVRDYRSVKKHVSTTPILLNSVATVVINLTNCQSIVINCLINLLSFCLKTLNSLFNRLLKFAFNISCHPIFPYLRPRELNPQPSTLNFISPMSNPTRSIPRSQKRWPISTIFTPENMHAIFVPYSCRHPFNSRFICGNSWRTIVPQSSPSSYHFRSHHRTAFVTVFIPLSFCQNFPNTYQSTNSKISPISQLSQLSQNSQLSTISTISTNSRPSPPSPTTKCSTE